MFPNQYLRRRRAVGSGSSAESASLTKQAAITWTAVTPGEAGNDITLECRIDGPSIDTIWYNGVDPLDFYAVITTTEGATPSAPAGPLTISYNEVTATGNGYTVFLSDFGAELPLQIIEENSNYTTIQLETDSGGIITTYAQLQTFINGNSIYVSASGGDGTTVAQEEVILSGGEDPVSACTATELAASTNSDFGGTGIDDYVTATVLSGATVIQPFAETNLQGGSD
jgi:hypothetical protein